jgi:hypothetical protein
MTAFVINIAKPFLGYMNSSLIDYGPPRGLIALILVAVSHSFHITYWISNTLLAGAGGTVFRKWEIRGT